MKWVSLANRMLEESPVGMPEVPWANMTART
jgi:hypothetical protein